MQRSPGLRRPNIRVSMKSGLEGRNNPTSAQLKAAWKLGLNEVRPRRPEQSISSEDDEFLVTVVSMKSGLEGRNNVHLTFYPMGSQCCLNEVRPRRPEQFEPYWLRKEVA